MTDTDRSTHLIVESTELLIHIGIFFSTAVRVGGDDVFDIGQVKGIEVLIFRERFIDTDIMDDRLLLCGSGENFAFQILMDRIGKNIIGDLGADRLADLIGLLRKIFVVELGDECNRNENIQHACQTGSVGAEQ